MRFSFKKQINFFKKTSNRLKIKEFYDVVIIGSGLGGLVSANIMAKEGYQVCVLEKNNQYGGNLQTFVRDRRIFDTGVHYIGGLDKGQNLYKYFNYLGIMEGLRLKKMDEDKFDIITFDDVPDRPFHHAQGYENFIQTLSEQFPEEEAAIRRYCDKLQSTCNSFPLYNLEWKNGYIENELTLKAKDYIESITENEVLRAVLAGSNILYAGHEDRTPFYVHALSVNSYIQSSWRCVNGGSQISKLLIKELRKHGGEVYKHQEVVDFGYENKQITSAITKQGVEVKAKLFISNIEPKRIIEILGKERIKKSYASRVKSLESIISVFSLYIVLKPEKIKYFNHNYYCFKDTKRVWSTQDYTPESWPEVYMISTSVKKNMGEWAESLTAMTYMNYDEVKEWETSFNTVAEKGDRGTAYEAFKEHKTEIFLKEIEQKFPNIRDAIASIHTSTPLSYRDYIGVHRGGMYGYVKDAENPIKSFLSPKTKIKNLFLTGQNLNMHGVLGVTISAVLTCSAIVGREYLLKKIIEANEEKEKRFL